MRACHSQIVRRRGHNQTDAPNALGLLRSRGERNRRSRAAKDTDKIPPPHARPQAQTRHRIGSNQGFDRG